MIKKDIILVFFVSIVIFKHCCAAQTRSNGMGAPSAIVPYGKGSRQNPSDSAGKQASQKRNGKNRKKPSEENLEVDHQVGLDPMNKVLPSVRGEAASRAIALKNFGKSFKEDQLEVETNLAATEVFDMMNDVDEHPVYPKSLLDSNGRVLPSIRNDPFQRIATLSTEEMPAIVYDYENGETGLVYPEEKSQQVVGVKPDGKESVSQVSPQVEQGMRNWAQRARNNLREKSEAANVDDSSVKPKVQEQINPTLTAKIRQICNTYANKFRALFKKPGVQDLNLEGLVEVSVFKILQMKGKVTVERVQKVFTDMYAAIDRKISTLHNPNKSQISESSVDLSNTSEIQKSSKKQSESVTSVNLFESV